MYYSLKLRARTGRSFKIFEVHSKLVEVDFNIWVAVIYFLTGDAETLGMTDVDGSGELAVKTSGSAEWLIVPYSEAAPYEDQQYDIGGTLYYTVNGQNLTVPLFPDTVTVTPDPRLYLNYFLERYVKSDDALTKGNSYHMLISPIYVITHLFQPQTMIY